MESEIKTNSDISNNILENQKTSVGSKLFRNFNMQFMASYFDFLSLKQDKYLGNPENFAKMREVAFFGRSNVGKSSLLNALALNQKLAYTSKKPGCTKSLNYYKFERNKDVFLVDLPGYGYAKINKDEIKTLNKMIENYFLKRTQLKKVYLLIDGRNGVQENDANFMKFFGKNEINYEIVLTKIDKAPKEQLEALYKMINEYLATQRFFTGKIIAVSSKKNINLDLLRADIYKSLCEV